MRKIMNLSLTAVLVAALTLTGACANIAHDDTRTRTEAVLACTGIGAALGLAIERLITKKFSLKGLGIGILGGALCGVAYGESVVKKKAAYASEEKWLDACLVEAQNANKEAVAYNSMLEKSLAGYRQEVALTQKQASEIKEHQDKSRAVLNTLGDLINSQEQAIASTANRARAQQLREENDRLRNNWKTLEKNYRQLASMSISIAM